MKAPATICCTIQLGSISSLRCQKSRKPRLSRLRHAKRCFRGRLFETNDDQPSGGARRDRTDALMLAKHALSQLSYGPVTRRRMLSSPRPVVTLRATPGTLRFVTCVAAPRVATGEAWWAWEDLN